MARQGQSVGKPPVVYPTVEVGGESYLLKFEIGAQFMLDEMGVNMSQLGAILGNPKAPGKMAIIIKLFAACVAGNFVDVGDSPPSAEQWAHRITTEDFKAICETLPKAIAKAPRPTEMPLRESDAPSTEMKQ